MFEGTSPSSFLLSTIFSQTEVNILDRERPLSPRQPFYLLVDCLLFLNKKLPSSILSSSLRVKLNCLPFSCENEISFIKLDSSSTLQATNLLFSHKHFY